MDSPGGLVRVDDATLVVDGKLNPWWASAGAENKFSTQADVGHRFFLKGCKYTVCRQLPQIGSALLDGCQRWSADGGDGDVVKADDGQGFGNL